MDSVSGCGVLFTFAMMRVSRFTVIVTAVPTRHSSRSQIAFGRVMLEEWPTALMRVVIATCGV
jgi:hypothetical protein